MCGRYSVASKLSVIEETFLAEFAYKYEPVYNAAPSLKLPVILSEEPNKIHAIRWGFVPHWEKNINKGLINARGEGVHTSKAFLKSIRERRCLVIANCFYEWGKKTRQPYLIYCENQKLFAFAGIYRPFVNQETGEVTNTFAILTTEPNPLMTSIDHHRMPVILEKSWWNHWLKADGRLAGVSGIADYQYSVSNMNAYPVSDLINKPVNNLKDVMEPAGERVKIIVDKPSEPKKSVRPNKGDSSDGKSFFDKHK